MLTSENQQVTRQKEKYIYFVLPHPELYLPNRRIASCYAWILSCWEDVASIYVHLQLSGIWIIVWPHNQVTEEVCAEAEGGAGDAEPQSFTLFRPLLLLLLLILDHLCCPDPDHNLGGWCYRKPKTPGEIVLLHGDSPLFTSSLTGCLKEEREKERRKEGERWGDYGEKKRR